LEASNLSHARHPGADFFPFQGLEGSLPRRLIALASTRALGFHAKNGRTPKRRPQ
jgi:hypothetical protein